MKDDKNHDELTVPQELWKVIEGHFYAYKTAERRSFHERESLDKLFDKIWEVESFAARMQLRDMMAELPDGKAIPKSRFDEEDKRRRLFAQAALKEAEKEEEKKRPTTKAVSFQKFPNGVIIEQVLQGDRVLFAVYFNESSEVTYLPELPDTDNNLRYVPYEDELVKKYVVWLPERAEPYTDTISLLEEIRDFIHRYLEIDAIYERLASYYVLFTWVYDAFANLPYLRALGDTGSGKSRLLSTIGGICYKPCFVAGAITPAPIYRVIEAYRGTLIIDEADFKDSEMYSEIVKILNVGFQKDCAVIRMEQNGQSYTPRAYHVFGPKILATRDRFRDDALENRMYTVIMRTCTRRDIPVLLPSSFYDEALRLRNKLLLFRFRNLSSAKADLTLVNETLEPRLNQILVPLASVIKEDEFREEFNDLMEQYQKEVLMDRATRWESEIVAAILELRDTKSNKFFSMGEIAEVVNSHRDPDDEKISARRVGSIVRRKLFLNTERTMKGYILHWEDNESEILSSARRYGLQNNGNMSLL